MRGIKKIYDRSRSNLKNNLFNSSKNYIQKKTNKIVCRFI